MSYKELNEAANEVFFDGRFEGVPIYLDLEDEIIDELAQKLGEKSSETELFIGLTVSDTLKWDTPNIYENHLLALKSWYEDDFNSPPPPFTALLLCLSLAAEHMREDEDYSSNNYYRRLAEVFDETETEKIVKIRNAGKYTRLFWQALNFWLTSNDNSYGRPTAKKVNSWTYVSYALSQSLIRDTDRKKFHKMFEENGISSGDKLTDQEMLLYLDQWMTSSTPSQWLRKLWKSDDLRERVVNAAQNELISWKATSSNSPDEIKTKRLVWLAALKTFPKPKASFFLGTASIFDNDLEFRLEKNSTELAQKAFGLIPNIHLYRLEGTEKLHLGPIEKLSLDALLLTNFKLNNSDFNIELTHSARPIIPLGKNETQPIYQEVMRATTHEKLIIICHENWIADVTAHLEKYARPGYTLLANNSLPAQWSLFTNVEFIKSPSDQVSDNLQCLVPLSGGATIQTSGGLSLSSGVWHAYAPPEIIASDGSENLTVKLTEETFGSSKRVIRTEEPDNFNPEFLYDCTDELENKNFVLTAHSNKSLKAEKQVLFKTANTPQIHSPNGKFSIVYKLSSENFSNILSGYESSEIEHQKSALLSGMLLNKDCYQNDSNLLGPLPDKLTVKHEQEGLWNDYDLTKVDGAAESCIIRGYHIWICEPYEGPGTTYSRVMTCSGCGATQVARKHRKKKKKKDTNNRTDFSAPNTQSHIKPYEPRKIDADTIYDALCYLGSGTWSKLESILAAHIEVPWQSREFARNLVDLGLIDAQLNHELSIPKRWSCPPPHQWLLLMTILHS